MGCVKQKKDIHSKEHFTVSKRMQIIGGVGIIILIIVVGIIVYKSHKLHKYYSSLVPYDIPKPSDKGLGLYDNQGYFGAYRIPTD